MPGLENIGAIIREAPMLAYLAVFFGGLLSAANPCVLVTIPLVIGYVGGYADGNRAKAFVFTVFFVLGLSATFTILGLVAALAGTLFGNIGDYWKYIVAGIVMFMGLYLMGLIRIPLPQAKMASTKRKGLLGSFMLGMLFGVVSSPCATPVLAVLLAIVSTQKQVLYGGSLLFTYALGHCMLMLAAGTFTGFAAKFIESKSAGAVSNYVKKFSGAIIFAVGVYLIF